MPALSASRISRSRHVARMRRKRVCTCDCAPVERIDTHADEQQEMRASAHAKTCNTVADLSSQARIRALWQKGLAAKTLSCARSVEADVTCTADARKTK